MPRAPDTRTPPRESRAPHAALVLIPVAIYLAHSAVLGSWIVDDAGISFAYARNLAAGYGLVAQPGVAPVEGFTNLLWVLILAATMKLGAFQPWLTPKLLALACVTGAFLGVFHLVTRVAGRAAWLATLALTVTAGITGFAVWCTSGLENALYAALVSGLAVAAARPIAPGVRAASTRDAVAPAVLMFLVFCTRPDGALYFWIAPFALGLAGAEPSDGGGRPGTHRASWAIYVAVFAGMWALVTVFRAAYFGDVLPNTFYAKGAEGAGLFAGLLARLPVAASSAVVIALGTMAMAAVAWGSHAVGCRLARDVPGARVARQVPVLFLVTAIAVHLALPGDWMGEYRFATPVMLFGPAALLGVLDDLLARLRAPRAVLGTAAVALLVATAIVAVIRTDAYRRAPTISFEAVRALSRRQAAAVAPLGRRASILTPDVGGALWEDRFIVIDYVGLVDQSLGRVVGRDPAALRDHILDVRRPEAIWLHTNWLAELRLEGDPRFRERYVTGWEDRRAPGAPLIAGFYVRRDVAAADTGLAAADTGAAAR